MLYTLYSSLPPFLLSAQPYPVVRDEKSLRLILDLMSLSNSQGDGDKVSDECVGRDSHFREHTGREKHSMYMYRTEISTYIDYFA